MFIFEVNFSVVNFLDNTYVFDCKPLSTIELIINNLWACITIVKNVPTDFLEKFIIQA